MSAISIIGRGGKAAAIGGLAAKAGHTVEVMSRDAAKARARSTRRRRHASRPFIESLDCVQWIPGRCPWRGHWSTPACCRQAS